MDIFSIKWEKSIMSSYLFYSKSLLENWKQEVQKTYLDIKVSGEYFKIYKD